MFLMPRTLLRRMSSHAWQSLRLLLLAFLGCLTVNGAALADEPSKEFWPEVDMWMRLNPEWRVSVFLPISKNIETDYREGNIIAQVDYAWSKPDIFYTVRLLDENRAQEMKAFLVRGGYLGGRSLDDRGQAYTEHTIFAELHTRIPLTGRVLMSHRGRTDFRWLGDSSPDFSYRLRYRLMIDKEFEAGGTSIVPYVNAEPYYDSRYSTVNRIRLIGGATIAWTQFFALETNITYQHDTRSSVTNLYAANVILHLFFVTDTAS
jgi:Protein of unknown function (DUF2490)